MKSRVTSRAGRTWWVATVISLFVGFMIATAGFALHPPVADIATPLICDGEAVHVTFRGPYHSSDNAGSPNIYCVTGGPEGTPEEITLSAIGISFLIYSAIAFLLVAPVALLLARRFRGSALPSRR